jgi:dipeptidyl aminopeptidase/acylaminoacyl peptidase
VQFPALLEVTELYLGGPIEKHWSTALAMSPLNHVMANNPPILIVHGACDAVVPVDESIIYYEALKKAGVDATLRIVPAGGHGFPIEAVRDDVVRFFTRVLQPSTVSH